MLARSRLAFSKAPSRSWSASIWSAASSSACAGSNQRQARRDLENGSTCLGNGVLGKGPFILRRTKFRAEAVTQPGEITELRQFTRELLSADNQGNGRLDSRQPAMLDPTLSDLLPKPFRIAERFPVSAVAILPFLDGQLLPLPFFLRVVQLGQHLVDSRVLGSRLEEIIEPLLQGLLCSAQTRQPGTGCEQQLAQHSLDPCGFPHRLARVVRDRCRRVTRTFPGSSHPGIVAAIPRG